MVSSKSFTMKGLVVVVSILSMLALPLASLAGSLTVTFLDVGQGDCALLQCDGETMLIDAGTNAGANALLQSLRDYGVTSFDIVVGTHPHEDHIGGLDTVISAFDVSSVWMPRVQHDTKTFEDVLIAIRDKGLTITAPTVGETHMLGDATITILGPLGGNYSDLNNYSIVLRVDHGSNGFLFAGDAESINENELIAVEANLEAAVLKVGHHGSDTSSAAPFLNLVKPLYAVISSAANNSYGHPHAEVVQRLLSLNALVLQTAETGDIVFESDGTSLTLISGSTYSIDTDNTIVNQDISSTYIGNKNSKIFHLPGCRTLPAPHNQVELNNRNDAITMGYRACQNCKP